MSGSQNEKKKKMSMPAGEAADMLRVMAEELEKGRISIDEEGIQVAFDAPVKISLKSKDDKLVVKIQFKLCMTGDDERTALVVEAKQRHGSRGPRKKGTGPKKAAGKKTENYKTLKKRMSKDFNAIAKCCRDEETLPDASLVEQFCRDSKQMCTYKGKGDAFYDAYLKAVESFYRGFLATDLEAIHFAVDSLKRMKKECHHKYK